MSIKNIKKKSISQGKLITNIVIFILCLALMTLYAPFDKPIWIDEFLHFAIGGFETLKDASQVIYKTIVEINHGQTGAYMLADFFLLKTFGASGWALRAPSILSTAWMLIAALSFLRTKGVGIAGQIGLLIAYAGQVNLMSYMGEARPYMPLAAAVVGALAYYAHSLEERRIISIRILGWLSIILGALMHPYFCLYWYVSIVFSYSLELFESERSFKFKELVAFANLPLILTGTTIALAVGSVSWLRRRTLTLDFDPFQWITQSLWVEFTTFSHFAFIPNARIYIALAVLMPVAYFIGPVQLKKIVKQYIGPSVLMIMGLLISVFLGYVSYTQKYWILHRQWIASEAIIPISLIWGISIIIKKMTVNYAKMDKYLWVICLVYLMHAEIPIVEPKLREQMSAIKRKMNENQSEHNREELQIISERNNDEWVELAKRNIKEGGNVWPIFRKYYELK